MHVGFIEVVFQFLGSSLWFKRFDFIVASYCNVYKKKKKKKKKKKERKEKRKKEKKKERRKNWVATNSLGYEAGIRAKIKSVGFSRGLLLIRFVISDSLFKIFFSRYVIIIACISYYLASKRNIFLINYKRNIFLLCFLLLSLFSIYLSFLFFPLNLLFICLFVRSAK